jgi:flagellar biosynthesis protein FlhF
MMKKHTFTGATSREVLQKVKLALGDDALILSNRTVGDGIEVVALAADAFEAAPAAAASLALDEDDAVVAISPRTQPVQKPVAPAVQRVEPRLGMSAPADVVTPAPVAPPVVTAAPAPSVEDFARAPQPWRPERIVSPSRAKPLAAEPAITVAAQPVIAPVVQPAPVPAAPAAMMSAPEIQGILREIQNLKTMLKTEKPAAAPAVAQPLRIASTPVLRDLLNAGFSPELARRVAAAAVVEGEEPTLQAVATRLAAEIKLADADEVISRGGVYALVGPTGVGKTTTVAKLAARGVVRFGASKVALVTTDSYRVGAYDQLRIYGRILGVPVHAVRDADDLAGVLAQLAGRHLVLIDTIGMSQRDRMIAEQAAMFAGAGDVKRLLLVQTTTNAATLNQVVSAYRHAGVHGCILTKTDEAASLAPALDAVIRHDLPVHYVTDGQRVPEDLQLPDAGALIMEALYPTTDPALQLVLEEIELVMQQKAPVLAETLRIDQQQRAFEGSQPAAMSAPAIAKRLQPSAQVVHG